MFLDPVLPGFRPDPTVCRVGDDYYLAVSSFEWFPALPLFHSRDLREWRAIGTALDRPSQLDLTGTGPSLGLYAPTLRHHEGVFHLVCTVVGRGHFVVVATDPEGPWSDPVWLPGEGFDPSLFFDDDGRAWFTAARGEVDTEIWLREYDPHALGLIGPEYVIWSGSPWSEAPHLYKVDDGYLLLTAQGGTAEDHTVVAARASEITGRYTGAPHNPVLPPAKGPVTCTGHADLVDSPAGSWHAVLLGVRPGGGMGRETFLAEVTWNDGWPDFAPVEHESPRTPVHDTFGELPPEWHTLGTPREPFWSTGNGLRLRLRPERLGERAVPSLLARPREHPDCDVSVGLDFTPAGPHEEAGLTVLLDDDTHLLFLRTTDGLRLGDATVALRPGPVRLGLRSRGSVFTFSYAADGPWLEFATVTAPELTPKFTALHLGLYATANGLPSETEAVFTDFTVSWER